MNTKNSMNRCITLFFLSSFFILCFFGTSFAGSDRPTAFVADLHNMTGEVNLSWQYPDYIEDFQDGVADNWSNRTCNWSVANGGYQVTNDASRTCSASLASTYPAYRFSVDIRRTAGGAINDFGIFFNGDPSSLSSGYWDNAYLLRIKTTGEWGLDRIQGGVITKLQAITTTPSLWLGDGVINRITLTSQDGKIEISFNGFLQGTFQDTTFPTGKIGLYMYDYYKKGNVVFDNIEIVPLGNFTHSHPFNIYRNNQLLASTPNNSYVDPLSFTGFYTYTVNAVVKGLAGAASEPQSVYLTGGTIQFEKANYQVGEGGGVVTITVTRTGGFGAIDQAYDIFPVTADSNDFTGGGGILHWGQGDITPRNIVLPIADDYLPENDETFQVNFDFSSPGGLGDIKSTTVTILDNDKVGFIALPMEGFAPLTVNFDDFSTSNIVSRHWDFGDGQTSTIKSPVHTFSSPGTYQVVETRVTGTGAQTETISIHVLPTRGGKLLLVPGQYLTIQNAVNAAVNGDSIFVREGTYAEKIIVNKEISLIGSGWQNTKIDASNLYTNSICDRPTLTINANNVLIRDLSIQGGYPGIEGVGNAIRIEQCKITNNIIILNCQGKLVTSANETGNNGLGIMGTGNSWVITNNLIVDNTSPRGGEGVGILLHDAQNFILENNTIARNIGKSSKYLGNGIGILAKNSVAILRNNIVADNDVLGSTGSVFGYGIYSTNSSLSLYTNDIFGNDDGTYNDYSTGPYNGAATRNYWGTPPIVELGTITTKPSFAGSEPGIVTDYSLLSTSFCIDVGTDPTEAGTADIMWNSRKYDGNGDGATYVDMGAFEYGARPWTPAFNPDQDGDGDVDGIDLARFAAKSPFSDKELQQMQQAFGR